jgi:hypothetical protein
MLSFFMIWLSIAIIYYTLTYNHFIVTPSTE